MAGLIVIAANCVAAANERSVLAFPGAEGFGAEATGGRGGRVLIIESLDDDPREPAQGTLRWACEKVQGPRIVVFRTGGVIELAQPITITHPNITIFAQTAPGDGICLKGSPLSIEADNVIVRGLRSRAGDGKVGIRGSYRRSMQIIGDVSDIIVDHCSLSWGVDDNLTIYGNKLGEAPRNVTVQWCLLAEALHRSIHPQGPHSMAMTMGGGNIEAFSLHHNLIAHHGGRNPRIVWGASGELINNIIYNWGNQAGIIQPHNPVKIKRDKRRPSEMIGARLNIIGNHWKRGPSSDDGPAILLKQPTTGTLLYVKGNVGPGRKMNTPEASEETAIVHCTGARSEWPKFLSSTKPALKSSNVTIDSVERTNERVAKLAGALLPTRDVVDRRIVDELKQGTGRIIDSPTDVDGYPAYNRGTPPVDADRDGMPDAWEVAHGLDKTEPDAGGHDLHPTYDNIEVYCNGLFPSTGTISP